MITEEIQLLLKDLCARLPYGVKILDIPANVVGDLFLVSTTNTVEYETNDGTGIQTLYNIKPYLRPMSSMTEEEKNERNFYCGYKPYYEEEDCGERYLTEYDMPDYIDWLNTHHFDYRGLIPMGLALEAPEGMYKKEESK